MTSTDRDRAISDALAATPEPEPGRLNSDTPVYHATREAMLGAVRTAVPAPKRSLRRSRPDHEAITEAILGMLPGAPDAARLARSAERIIAERDKTVGDLDATIAELRDQLEDREETITGLREGLEHRAEEAAKLTRRTTALTKRADELEARSATLQAQIAEFAGETARAERAERELARVAAALVPLTAIKGMTIADRAKATAQLRESIKVPAEAAEVAQ